MLHEHTQTLKLAFEKLSVLRLLRDTEDETRDLKRRGSPSVVDEALDKAFEYTNLDDLMDGLKFDEWANEHTLPDTPLDLTLSSWVKHSCQSREENPKLCSLRVHDGNMKLPSKKRKESPTTRTVASLLEHYVLTKSDSKRPRYESIVESVHVP